MLIRNLADLRSTQMVTDFGSHEELMARDGPYASLYRASV
jgi:ABC-type multidrug transport system fused ATPase/permease subunit